MKSSMIMLLTVGLVAGGLCGCQQEKFTRQRYETIYPSMPDWQVRQILGEPTAIDGETWTYVRVRPYCKVVLRFEKGRLKDTSWTSETPRTAGGP